MSSFTQTLQNIFRIDELKQRIIFTVLVLLVVRIGAQITLPGINVQMLHELNRTSSGNDLFGLFDLFVGGAFSNAALFALGIMPYITSSIIFQLAGIVIPEIAKMQKEGEEGRRKINQYTRLFTVVVAGLQAWAMSIRLTTMADQAGNHIYATNVVLFTITTTIVLTAGTLFLMWLGEQITERGLGNGISLIIMVGIVSRLVPALIQEYNQVFVLAERPWVLEIVVFTLLIVIIASVIYITQGARRIPVQYAKRQVGKKVFGGTTQYIPLRVNTAGVMPIIFAQSLMFIPNTVYSFFPDNQILFTIANAFREHGLFYSVFYAFLIIAFTYFYTAIVFNPKEIADNMKKNGGFIPGIRPGKPTSDYVDHVLARITLPGSMFLALIAILPTFASNILGVTGGFASFFGGTSLLIVVGVALDTLQQIESYLLMRHYDGFMKSGKIKGRVS
jgi:preprotein translocase subunit SecY